MVRTHLYYHVFPQLRTYSVPAQASMGPSISANNIVVDHLHSYYKFNAALAALFTLSYCQLDTALHI